MTNTFTPPLFHDLGKKARELFCKKYNYGNSVGVKHQKATREAGNLTIETTGSFGSCVGGDVKVTCDHKQGKLELKGTTFGYGCAKLEAKELAPSLNVTVDAFCGGYGGKGSCGTGSCGTGGSKRGCGTKAACDDKKSCDTKDAKAGDTKCASTASCAKKCGVKARADYRRESVAGSLGVAYCCGNVCLTPSVVLGYKGVSLGAQACVNPASGEGALQSYNVAAQYDHADAVVTVNTRQFRSFTVDAYHPVNRDYTVGFGYKYNPDKECASAQRVLSAGLEYAAAPDTTIKAKASTCGNASLNVEHRLPNPKLLLAFSAGFNLPQGGSSCGGAGVCPVYPDKFGVQVTFGDF